MNEKTHDPKISSMTRTLQRVIKSHYITVYDKSEKKYEKREKMGYFTVEKNHFFLVWSKRKIMQSHLKS